MVVVLKYLQVVISVLLIAAIVIQNRSSGLSAGGSNSIQTNRRGAEKFVYNFSIILAVFFAVTSLAFLFVK